MDLFSFIECANQTKSLKALFDLLVSCASQERFHRDCLWSAYLRRASSSARYQPPAIAVNFPASWCERYFERKYYEIDPVVRRTPTLLRPFMWDQLADQCQLQPGEQLVLNESREAGLKHGVSVPLFGPLGVFPSCRLHARYDDAEPLHRMSHLNALAWQFHIAFTEIARPEENSQATVDLSKRERDCLRWTAEGKSSWDIGMILNISENKNTAVNFTSRTRCESWGTTSRTVAVVKAIRPT